MITDIDIEKLKKIFLSKVETATQLVTSIIQWTNIIGKPTVFPPDTHTHVEADITDLQDYALKSNVLELDNTTAFTPDADYEPATKKYVDDNAGGGFFNKLDATTAPTVNDDSGEGYSVGSVWIDITNDLIYQATDVTVGSAVWKCLSSVILDDAPSDGETYGRKDGLWAQIITGGILASLVMSPSIEDDQQLTITAFISTAITWV